MSGVPRTLSVGGGSRGAVARSSHAHRRRAPQQRTIGPGGAGLCVVALAVVVLVLAVVATFLLMVPLGTVECAARDGPSTAFFDPAPGDGPSPLVTDVGLSCGGDGS
jgi:hypothetical protein